MCSGQRLFLLSFCGKSLLPSKNQTLHPPKSTSWPSSQSRACQNSVLDLSPYCLSYLTWVTLPRRGKSKRKIAIKWDNITGYLYSTVWGTKMFNYQSYNKKCLWMFLSIPLSPGYPSLPGCPGTPFSPFSPLLPGGPGGPGGPGSPGFNLSSQTGTGFLACSWMNESNFNTWAERGRHKMNVSLAGKFRKEAEKVS